jgi:hypothetical protein
MIITNINFMIDQLAGINFLFRRKLRKAFFFTQLPKIDLFHRTQCFFPENNPLKFILPNNIKCKVNEKFLLFLFATMMTGPRN